MGENCARVLNNGRLGLVQFGSCVIGQSSGWCFQSPFVLCGYCHRAMTHKYKCWITPILAPALVLLEMERSKLGLFAQKGVL